MDPIGFGFESYDAVGRFREKDGTFTVDASGEILNAGDANGTFNGTIELAQRLAESEEVRGCVVTQWFRYAYGRGETDADVCTLARLKQKFAASKYDARELLIALTQTPAFRYRRVKEGGAP